jgi:hydroxyacylglutathione hydrolase
MTRQHLKFPMTPTIHVIPVLSDNYAYAVCRGEQAVIVDPGEAAPVVAWLARTGHRVSAILLTHYDGDHTGGVAVLRRRGDVTVAGPAPAPFEVDVVAEPGESLALAGMRFEVVDCPGHAIPHVAYHLPVAGALFTGDCLFGGGCGRFPPAAAAIMWDSIGRLARFPDETRLYFGHEYTLSNLAFAATVEPDNPAITRRREQAAATIARGEPSAPSTLAEERMTNPFLRVAEPAVRQWVGMPADASPAAVLGSLRQRKNSFRG